MLVCQTTDSAYSSLLPHPTQSAPDMHQGETTDGSGIRGSFRVIPAPIRVRVIPEDRETGSRFSPFYDAFHLPFPSRARKLTIGPFDALDRSSDESHKPASSTCVDGPSRGPKARNTEDPLFRLPAEISDLILSYLSPAALDAARYTCKFWRRNIMGNPWVLSTVMNRKAGCPPYSPREPGSEGEMTIRNLLKSLDQESHLLSTYLESDAWRTRFRVRSLEFSTAEVNGDCSPAVSAAQLRSATRIGSQFGLMILQVVPVHILPILAPSTKSMLLFFHFDSHDFPHYAGYAEHPASEGTINTVSTAEIEPRRSWILTIQISDQLRSYSVESRKSFSKSDTPFCITELEDPQATQQLGGLVEEKLTPATCEDSTRLTPSNQLWKMLVSFPTSEGGNARRHLCNIDGSHLLRVYLTGGVHQLDGSPYLVRHVSSDNVIATKRCNRFGSPLEVFNSTTIQDDPNRYLFGLPILLHPYDNCIFRNIAIAPVTTRHGTVRVAIIWQSRDVENRRLELYIYDVPEACCHGDHGASSESPRATLGDFPDHRVVQGKRVTSINHQMGGIHPSSPVWGLASTAAAKETLQRECALGGLQVPHSISDQDSFPHNLQYQKCFVWGPVENQETVSIQCKIFDFSFADPHRLKSMISKTAYHSEAWRYLPEMNRLHCACALHDDGFRIVLPPTEQLATVSPGVQKQTEKRHGSSFWPWKCKDTAQVSEHMPVVTRNDSVARQEALDRETEWLRQRIRAMKRADLSNFDIAELWGSARWAQYGQVRKPDGWENL